MEQLTYLQHEVRRSEHDWLIAGVVDKRFEVACGPLNLNEAIHRLRLRVADGEQGRS